jgi:Leucine-rich repeat (LRR) protein
MHVLFASTCSFNQLQQLPAGVEALCCLKVLDMADNPHLRTLPAAIAQLPCLASINCSNCSLQELPDALGLQQPQLSLVQAAGNQLKVLPAGDFAGDAADK